MAPKAQIQVEGLRELLRDLRKAGDKETLDAIKSIHKEAADDVRDTARPLIPVRTGKLAKSLRSTATARAGVVRAGRAAVPYAGPIHFGWPTRPNPSKGWRGGPIEPNTFLYDALDKRKREVEEAFRKRVEKIVQAFD